MIVAEKETGISVGRTNGDVHVRVAGRGTFQNGQPLRRYATEMIRRGARQFVIDLEMCDGMDSTFLGVLAGIGLQLNEPVATGQVRVVNANSRNVELLQTLGLDRIFAIATVSDTPADVTLQRLPDSDFPQLRTVITKNDTAELMMEAHTNLIRADGRNQAKFQDLTAVLRARTDQHLPDKTS